MSNIRRSVLLRLKTPLLVLLFASACSSTLLAQPQTPQRKEASQETVAANVNRLVDRLSSPKPRERASATVALGKLGADAKRAVPVLIKMLRDDAVLPGGEFDTHVSTKASWALEQIGKPAVPSLLALLSNEDGALRQRAILALGEIRDGRAIDPLLRALDDDEDYVRESAASALGHIQDPKAVEPLIGLLANEPFDVMGPLGEIGDQRAVSHLIPLLKHEKNYIREHAAFALEEIADPRALKPLLALLDDESVEVRTAAVNAIGEFRDPATVEPLAKLLNDVDVRRWDKNVEFRQYVISSLVMIGGPHAEKVLRAAAMDQNDVLRLHAEHAVDCFKRPEALGLHTARGAHSPVALQRRIYDLVKQGDASKLVAAVYPDSLTDGQQRDARTFADYFLFGHQFRNALRNADEKLGCEVSKAVLKYAKRSLPRIALGDDLDAMLSRGRLSVNGDHAQTSDPRDLHDVSPLLVAFTRYERMKYRRWFIPGPMLLEENDLKEMRNVVGQFELFHESLEETLHESKSAEQYRTSVTELIRGLRKKIEN